MILFVAQGRTRPLIGLGLEPENLTRLQAGDPIHQRLPKGTDSPVPDVDVLIFTGGSREDMLASLGPLITDRTTVHDLGTGHE
jgi:hypothetical protein